MKESPVLYQQIYLKIYPQIVKRDDGARGQAFAACAHAPRAEAMRRRRAQTSCAEAVRRGRAHEAYAEGMRTGCAHELAQGPRARGCARDMRDSRRPVLGQAL